MISGCAATHQAGRYASAGCDLAACAPAASPTNSRYGTPMAKNYCYAPPIMIVPQVRPVQVEKPGHLEERVFWASIEANFIVVSQVRLHRVTHACPQAYFGMILARISGGIRILNRIRLWTVVAHGKRGGGSCSLGWPW